MDKKKICAVALAIIGIIVLGTMATIKLTSATPKKLSEAEMDEVLTLLSSTSWSLDNDKRNKRIEELSLSNLVSLEIGEKRGSYLPLIINTADGLGFEAKIVKGEDGLKLISTGCVLDIWYSENKTLTLMGDTNYLVFLLDR